MCQILRQGMTNVRSKKLYFGMNYTIVRPTEMMQTRSRIARERENKRKEFVRGTMNSQGISQEKRPIKIILQIAQVSLPLTLDLPNWNTEN